jgi:hypothetical protein
MKNFTCLRFEHLIILLSFVLPLHRIYRRELSVELQSMLREEPQLRQQLMKIV